MNTIENENEVVLPIIEETVSVDKRVVESGGVRIIKTVSEREESIVETTVRESAQVERVLVNRLLGVGEPLPSPRTEGDVLIVPVFEEVLILEKRVRVTEELHIRRERVEISALPQTVTLRREAIRIESIEENDREKPANDTTLQEY